MWAVLRRAIARLLRRVKMRKRGAREAAPPLALPSSEAGWTTRERYRDEVGRGSGKGH